MGNITLPKEAGYRIGSASSHASRHVILEIHYDNPTRAVDMVDSSGARLYYTSTIRQYDAGTITLGDVVPSFSNIPPQQEFTEYEANCPTECTSKWPFDITVFSSFQHMHQIGKQMWSTHWRGPTMLGYLNRVDYFQFDFQQGTPLNTVIKRGDRINLHCAFDSSRRTAPTRFSIASEDEMCMEFISYYPLIIQNSRPFVFCGHIQAAGITATWCGDLDFSNVDWSLRNPTIRDPPGTGKITFGTAPDRCVL